jgi:hypothetical protein
MNITAIAQAAVQAATSGPGSQKVPASTGAAANQLAEASKANLTAAVKTVSEERGPQEAGETTEAREGGAAQAGGKVNAYA